MRRRSRASSKLAKARSRKAKTLKAVRHSSSPVAGQETEVARFRRERDEAQEQQAATAEVLKVISRSTFDLQAVLDTLVKSAARLCQADMVSINRPRGGAMHFAANFGLPQEFEEIAKRTSFVPGRGTVVGRVLLAGKPVQIADVKADLEFTFTKGQRVAGFRTVLGVPLDREGEIIGVMVLARMKVQPFSDKQIELVQNFATQAVIAIENARLLKDLRESLDRQTATADILRVIAGTPEDSKRALDTIAEAASRMFDVAHVNFRRLEGNVLRIVSSAGSTVVKLREALPDLPLEPTDPVVRSFLDNRQIAVEDRRATLADEHGEIARALRKLPGLPIASQAFTPLSREGKAIGVMIVNRREVRPFQEHELDLMKGFADQAVIAIENARLLNELRESLQQQTATADVLKIISRSTFDLKAVLGTLVESATHVCEADIGNIALPNADGTYQIEADYAQSAALGEELRRQKLKPGPGSLIGRTALSRSTTHILDAQTDPDYELHEALKLGDYHTMLGVPLLREGDVVGIFGLARTKIRPFTEKQIELVTTFADQAVIAIENARLLNELRQSLEQQTATADVLGVISSSPGELQPVFTAMLANATRLCDAPFGNLFLCEGEPSPRCVTPPSVSPCGVVVAWNSDNSSRRTEHSGSAHGQKQNHRPCNGHAHGSRLYRARSSNRYLRRICRNPDPYRCAHAQRG
jgi:GAF domain-containing protein